MPRDNVKIQIKAIGADSFKKWTKRFFKETRKAFGISWIHWQGLSIKFYLNRWFKKKQKWSASREHLKNILRR